MQGDNDDNDDGGYHPSAYQNDPPRQDVHSFEVPADDVDDDGYFQRLGPTFDRLGRPMQPSGYKWSSDDDPDGRPRLPRRHV